MQPSPAPAGGWIPVQPNATPRPPAQRPPGPANQAPPRQPASPASPAAPAADGRWALDRYVVREKRLTIGRQYHVLDAQGRLVAYCKQKMFKLREDIRFYADESLAHEIFRMTTRKIMDFRAAMDVVDSRTGATIGSLRRKGWKSLIKDEWLVFDAEGRELARLHEDNAFFGFVRRFVNLGTLLPAKYTLEAGPSKATVARIKERFQLWGDTYDVERDVRAGIDARLLIGLTVLTDALGVGGKGV